MMSEDNTFRQPNIISRAPITTNSTLAMKTVKYGLFKILSSNNLDKYENINLLSFDNIKPEYWKDFTAEFSLTEFAKDLNLSLGGPQRKVMQNFVNTAKQTESIVLKLDDDHVKIFPWFNEIDINKGKVMMTFSPQVIHLTMREKNFYSKLNLSVIGALTSTSAIRYYELIMSYYNMVGKKIYGNNPGEWDTKEYSIDELREYLNIEKDLYPRPCDFKTRCVVSPIEELRKNIPNLSIEIEDVKLGKKIEGFIFHCKEITPKKLIKKDDNIEEVNQKKELNEMIDQDAEEERIVAQFEKAWNTFFDEYKTRVACPIKTVARHEFVEGLRKQGII